MSKAQELLEKEAYQVAVRLSRADYTRVEALVKAGLYRSSADFLREAVRDKLREMDVVSLQDVSLEEAERLIGEYLDAHPGARFASEIADALGLEYGLVFKAVRRMLERGVVRKGKP
jgi:Arc/MetJ-type ribon-helix-helix transcriptional regulator